MTKHLKRPLEKFPWRETWPYLALIVCVLALALSLAHHTWATSSSNDGPWWNFSGAWVALFTLVLTLSTIALWYATLQQMRTTRDEFNATHRPKIIIHSISLPMDFSAHEPDDMNVGAHVMYFNIGPSPAKIIDIRARVWRQHRPLQSGTYIHDEIRARCEILESGMKDYIRVRPQMPMSLNFEKTIQRADDTSRGVLVCMGTIRYKDGREAIRETGFCFRFDAISERWISAEEPEYEYAY